MDSSRLGRVLGIGARNAAKTLVGAVDAATAPNPRQSGAAPRGTPSPVPNATPSSMPSPTPSAVPSPVPNPTQAVRGPGSASVSRTAPATQVVQPASRESAGDRPGARARSAEEPRRGVAEGGRRFGRAVWEPTVRLGGVLWLEVTGLFFGIFVLVAAGAAWRLRGGIHAGAQHSQFLLAVGMTVVFGYFTASSFVSANRRSRRR